ncbi:GATA zinc finger domain-containing protein [Mycena kentingensis (nom. inval.)]|nr:GATA zinc finger domain-containing protein [Mycena kentingensis (nom. inval.)]
MTTTLHSSSLFHPLPLLDRDEHTRTVSPPMRSSFSWSDDRSPRDSYTPYSPYPRRDSLPSPLAVVNALPHPTRSHSTLPYPRGPGGDSPHPINPTIDLNALIPLDYPPNSPALPSGKLGGLYPSAADDWSYGSPYHHQRTLPPLNWPDSASSSASHAHAHTHGHGHGHTAHFGYGGGDGYSPSSPYASDTTSSGSTSPSYFLGGNAPVLPPPPHTHSRSARGVGAQTLNADGSAPKKECFHCHVTTTPLWRREPQTQRPLCNACGLYLQQRNKLRPQELIDADRDDSDDEINRIPDSEYTGPKCSHCLTRQTSVWRRNKAGQQVCNACGVYARLRGKERPLSLRRNKIKPRTKHTR